MTEEDGVWERWGVVCFGTALLWSVLIVGAGWSTVKGGLKQHLTVLRIVQCWLTVFGACACGLSVALMPIREPDREERAIFSFLWPVLSVFAASGVLLSSYGLEWYRAQLSSGAPAQRPWLLELIRQPGAGGLVVTVSAAVAVLRLWSTYRWRFDLLLPASFAPLGLVLRFDSHVVFACAFVWISAVWARLLDLRARGWAAS